MGDAADHPPALSVIVPTLNEASVITRTCRAVLAQQGVALELIVSDSGSTDATVSQARAAGARVVTGGPGRAVTLNAGRAAARAPVLLFLHADSRLDGPDMLARALACHRAAMARAGHHRVAGHWEIGFEWAGARPPGIGFFEAKSTLIDREETHNGDQGLLISAAYLDALGGFDTGLPFLEDQILARHILRTGRWVLLPGVLFTSARRFERAGLGRQMLQSAVIMAMLNAGLESFLHSPDPTYRAHGETGRLRMAPFLRRAATTTRRLPPRARIRAWGAVGRYTRRNTWQLFFALDCRAPRRDPRQHHPWLDRYDRWVAHRLDHPAADAAATLAAWAGFHTVWWTYQLREGKDPR